MLQEILPIYDQKQLCLRFMDIQYEERILAHKKEGLVDGNSNKCRHIDEENDSKAKEERPKHNKQRKYSKSDAVHEEQKHQLDQI